MRRSDLIDASPAVVREALRAGAYDGPTAGLARGYQQANLVVLPASEAGPFAAFCEANARPLPLLARTEPGEVSVPELAAGADLRTDLPRYRVFRRGVANAVEPSEVASLWRDDFVGFLLGCSFTLDSLLLAAGLPVRHVEQGRNVPMYRTSEECVAVGRFASRLVVSMRPFAPELVDAVVALTAEHRSAHGAPVAVGAPSAPVAESLGIESLERPDFGEAVDLRAGEVPLFWACGVTSQLAIEAARPELAITHAPGHMLVLDRPV